MKKLETVARKGDQLETLRLLRQRLANAIDTTESARDIASLSHQLREVLDQIAELEHCTATEKPKEASATVLSIVRARHESGA